MLGFQIAQEYYKNASDKERAIADIIEMNINKVPGLSRYDQKQRVICNFTKIIYSPITLYNNLA